MSAADKVDILVVDDLPERLLVAESVLEQLAENVLTARSGREALRLSLTHEFAVILLDVNMPEMDGLETAALIRGRKKSAHTPIIFMTAYADEMHTLQGYTLGAVDYIMAPVVPEVLRSKVRVFVHLFRMQQQIKRQAEERVALASEQAARAAAEEATRRSAFLARAGVALVSSLDYAETLDKLLRVVVPTLADLAAVTMLREAGQPWTSELAWVYPPEPDLYTGTVSAAEGPRDAIREALDRVLATGKPEELRELHIDYPPPGCVRPEPSPRQGQLNAALIVPLLARSRTVGALTLALGCSRRQYTPADLDLAQELAARAAIALDNAKLYQSVQEADARKNEFLAMLAHELRNPLAPIRNAVEVMRLAGPQAPLLVEARDMIGRQVTHMARLIDDLLDMSRIARGKVLVRQQNLDLVELVRRTAEDYRANLASAGLQLVLRLPDAPLWIHGDPTRLAQVVGNLMHNAQKFTDTGGQITVGVVAEADGATACVSIRDSGIGMEPEMLARAFDTFSQADRSLDRSRGGLGLGLALVKGLVELHRGIVTASSEGPGQGTEVVIRLPLKAPPATPAAQPSRTANGTATCRVLVIEDNRDTADSMRLLLQMAGHEVEVAYTGQVGVQAARTFRPQVVLCDIGVPGGMDGYAVARTLREDAELSRAFLVALTGYGQEEDRRRSQEAGFDVHLTKPVDFQELQQLFARVPAVH